MAGTSSQVEIIHTLVALDVLPWKKIHKFCFSESRAKLELLTEIFLDIPRLRADGVRYSPKASDLGKTLVNIVNAGKREEHRTAAAAAIDAFNASGLGGNGRQPPKSIREPLDEWDSISKGNVEDVTDEKVEGPASYGVLKLADVKVGDIIVSCSKGGRGRVGV